MTSSLTTCVADEADLTSISVVPVRVSWWEGLPLCGGKVQGQEERQQAKGQHDDLLGRDNPRLNMSLI